MSGGRVFTRVRLRPAQAKNAMQLRFAEGREQHGARTAEATDPSALESQVCQCRADNSGEVRPPLGPVDAAAGERTAPVAVSAKIDAELAKLPHPFRCDFVAVAVRDDQ